MEDCNYCVYLHKTKEGVVFYVGSGREKRAKMRESSTRETGCATGRGKDYSKYVSEINFEYDVEIVRANLNKNDSIAFEAELYDLYKATIVNKRRPSPRLAMDMSNFESILYYDDTSKSCLRWGITTFGKVIKGNEAGSLSKDTGYFTVRVNNINYQAHRVVCTLHGYTLSSDSVVDHIDGNPSNNKIENLRVVSQKENQNNCIKRKDNTSGVVGVSYCKIKNHFIAHWYEDYKFKRVRFSCKRLGHDLAFQLARECRLDAEIRLSILSPRDYLK